MTDTFTQNMITNFNINQMPNTNLSDYKISDASGTDFSNVMANAANAKAQNTQTNFVDKAAKTNTSSINKKALEKEVALSYLYFTAISTIFSFSLIKSYPADDNLLFLIYSDIEMLASNENTLLVVYSFAPII